MFPQRHHERIRIDQNAQHTAGQRLQLREQKTLTETSQEVTRNADACLRLARVAFKLYAVVKWSGYVQQGTGVQLLTVEQECLLLEADVKHSEAENLFSLLNAPPPSALFLKCRLDHSENTNSESELNTISKGNRHSCLQCAALPFFVIMTLSFPTLNPEKSNVLARSSSSNS